jgi:hypothetical protein
VSFSRRWQLHWICRIPTRFRDFLCRSLAADAAIDLTVHFIERIVPILGNLSSRVASDPARTAAS